MIVHQENSKRMWRQFDARAGEMRGALARRDSFDREGECRSAAGTFALGFERTAVSLSERFRDRQSQTETTKTALEGTVALFKRIEHALHDLPFDADAGVADR